MRNCEECKSFRCYNDGLLDCKKGLKSNYKDNNCTEYEKRGKEISTILAMTMFVLALLGITMIYLR